MKRVTALALAICAPAFAATASTPAPPFPATISQLEMNKAVARRVFEEIFNQGKFQVADEIYAPDFVNHGLRRDVGLQQDQAAVHWEKQAFPDLKMTVDRMLAEGDLVTVVWTLRGTNTAAASPLPATGVTLQLRGITVWRIVAGKIREEWTSFDLALAARQFVAQLKWQLIGLFLVAVILLLAAGRATARLRLLPAARR